MNYKMNELEMSALCRRFFGTLRKDLAAFRLLPPIRFSTAAVCRFGRSRGRSIESIGSVSSVILQIFCFCCNVGELEICLVSKFQLCTTLGDRKNTENRNAKFLSFSVWSVRYSVRFDRYWVRGLWWTALVMESCGLRVALKALT